MRGMMFAALFAALTAAVSPIRIPLGFTPVPITLQTLMVLLSGAILGARYGALSQVLYLSVGILGLPVFAGGSSGLPVLFGPTGGYLLSYPIAAFCIGWLSEKKRAKGANVFSMTLILLLIAIAYCDLLFGLGLMKFDNKPLSDILSFESRILWIAASAALIGGLLLLLFYLKKKKRVDLHFLPAMFSGTIIIYIMGAVYGKIVTGLPWMAVLAGWVLPFIIGDTIKLLAASIIASRFPRDKYFR